MNHFKIKNGTASLAILFGFLVISVCVVGAQTAKAAYFHVSPSSGSYYKGENFEVRILVNSDTAINAVAGVLTFPTQYLKIVEINKKNSIINLWIGEPSFSNAGQTGNIRFEGIMLNPGFIGSSGRVVNIIFRADDKGAADVNFIQSAILANDGLGTNVVTANTGAKFILLPPRALSQTKESVPEPQTIIIRELPQEEFLGILSFWKVLPNWVKTSVLISIGITTIIFSFIVFSFGVIVFIWLWSNIWHRRDQFLSLLRLATQTLKNFVFKVLSFLGTTEREIKGDIQYSFYQLISRFKNAPDAPSFKSLVRDYFFLIRDTAKRFFTKNTFEEAKEPKDIGSSIGKEIEDIDLKNKTP